MRLQRFFVTGFPPGTESLVSEFLLFHGIGSVTVTDRPDHWQGISTEPKQEPKA